MRISRQPKENPETDYNRLHKEQPDYAIYNVYGFYINKKEPDKIIFLVEDDIDTFHISSEDCNIIDWDLLSCWILRIEENHISVGHQMALDLPYFEDRLDYGHQDCVDAWAIIKPQIDKEIYEIYKKNNRLKNKDYVFPQDIFSKVKTDYSDISEILKEIMEEVPVLFSEENSEMIKFFSKEMEHNTFYYYLLEYVPLLTDNISAYFYHLMSVFAKVQDIQTSPERIDLLRNKIQ